MANVVFYHYAAKPSRDAVLETAIHHALNTGHTAYVITNTNRFDHTGAQVVPTSNFSKGIDDFEKLYVHLSPTRYDFELHCFTRWFAYRDFLDQVQDAYFIDRDILVYDGFEDCTKLKRPDQMFDTAWFNHAYDNRVIARFCDYMTNCYRDPGVLDDMCRRIDEAGWNKNPNGAHVADMLLLYLFAEDNPDAIVSLKQNTGAKLGFDSNINVGYGYETHDADRNFLKKVYWDDGIPYVRQLSSNDFVRARTLHFQGHSKPLMKYYSETEDMLRIQVNPNAGWWPQIETEIEKSNGRFPLPETAKTIDPLG